MQGSRWRRGLLLVLSLVAFAGLTTAESCAEAARDLEKSTEDLEKSTTPNKSINRKVRSLELGMSKSEVRSIMGKPDNTQEMNSEYGKSEFLYYGQWR